MIIAIGDSLSNLASSDDEEDGNDEEDDDTKLLEAERRWRTWLGGEQNFQNSSAAHVEIWQKQMKLAKLKQWGSGDAANYFHEGDMQ